MKYRSQIQQRSNPGDRPEGFTLVEALVVITIIAILAALLLTVISNRKGDAQQAVCLNNQRQLVAALMMYADSDSKGSFGGTQGRRQYYPEVDENWVMNDENLSVKIFFCPATRNGSRAEEFRANVGRQRVYKDLAIPADDAASNFGYSYDPLLWFADMEDYWNGNSHSIQNSRFVEKTSSSVQSYAHANQAFDMKGQRLGPSRIWLLTDNDPELSHNEPFWPEQGNNHRTAGANAGFADGHVEWIQRQNYVVKYEASQDNNRTKAVPRPRL